MIKAKSLYSLSREIAVAIALVQTSSLSTEKPKTNLETQFHTHYTSQSYTINPQSLMDSFRINNIQVEKANAIMKHHRQLRKMANWFRLIEICVVLLVVSRFSSQLPLAVKNSGGYFRELTVFIVSPRFVFVVGNLIVITLFAKSGQFSSQDSPGKNSGSDLIKEFVDKSEKTQNIHRQEIEYREKQSTCAEKVASDEIKHYKRSQSEDLRRVSCNKPYRN
ncbi:hypothetical protein LWI28_004274 [Acer negundo]|uniref:DUF4408 domain-containing protein n=1 Tax=Acer negundo TaxID=4023 RepID=A0AAD5J2Q2_ACENE|nr:hypothetical protein LWI28_004274 [Acer negundo]